MYVSSKEYSLTVLNNCIKQMENMTDEEVHKRLIETGLIKYTDATYYSCDNCGFEFIVLDKNLEYAKVNIERCPKCGLSKECLHERIN